MKRDAIAIFTAALAAADARLSTLQALKRLKPQVDEFDRVFLVAVGKAAPGMAAAVESYVGERLTGGVVLTKYGHLRGKLRTRCLEAAHPVPDERGVEASTEIEELLRGLNAKDLLIVAVSGGTSALLTAPVNGIALADKQKTTSLTLRAGADIFELNAVRKHLSRLKGGRMAALAYPATVISLLLSDVIGDPVDVIGSGPTAPDTSTLQDALGVIKKYELYGRIPVSVRRHLDTSEDETPKASSVIFHNVRNVVTAGNREALAAAARKARELGYRPLILSSSIQGEAREVARVQAAILRDAPANSCILFGGETTVHVRGQGKGGRNQEAALAIGIDIAGLDGIAALCAGTDGTDGPTDAAGAFVTGRTFPDLSAARSYLADNNSYEILEARKALLKIGPTGTNVMDIVILLKRPRA